MSHNNDLAVCVAHVLDRYFADLDGETPDALYEMVMRQVERPLLEYALQRSKGNQTQAAELLGITRESFRQQLARARSKLSGFMRGRCGLVDPQAPCRCARKTQAFVRDGIVDAKRIQFARGHVERIEQEGTSRTQALAAFQRATLEDLRDLYPWFEPPEVVDRLRKVLESDATIALLDLNTSGGAA